jgi:PadR family transcriptional regulator PadR
MPSQAKTHRTGDPMSENDPNFIQGTVDLLILKSLQAEPRHGYGVAAWIRATSDEAFQIEEGALYTALHRMKARGWVESEWGRSKNNRQAKYYRLTDRGRAQLERASDRWESHAEAVGRVLGADLTDASA